MEELQAAVQSLRDGGELGSLSGAQLVITGSGFSGDSRQAIRQLAALAGFAYSGDLVRGRTTHLVLLQTAVAADSEASCATGAGEAAQGTAAVAPPSSKAARAGEWGIPVVQLRWLLDSVSMGIVQPVLPYASSGLTQQQAVQGGHGSAVAPSTQHRHRPSSVASNPGLGAGHTMGRAAALVRQDSMAQNSSVHQAQQQQVQGTAACRQHPRPGDARLPLGPVANMLADRLQRMSISPEPPAAAVSLLGAAAPTTGGRLLPPLCTALPGPPGDSPPLQRSPSLAASPQCSLSLQGLVVPGCAGTPPGGTSGANAASAECSSAGWGQSTQEPQHPGPIASPQGTSPMQQSPAAVLPLHDSQQQQPAWQRQQSPQQHQQQLQMAGVPQQQLERPGRSGRAQLAKSPADDLPAGSPMAESPAASDHPLLSPGVASAAASMQRRRSWLGHTPSSQGGQPLCTMPTPACVREWSDDDSLGHSAGGGSPGFAGVTQTPPDVRRALEAANALTQWPARAAMEQQQQPQQQPCEAAAAHGMHGSPPSPAAVLQDSDGDETEASEGMAAADELVLAASVAGEEEEPGEQQQVPPLDGPLQLQEQELAAAAHPLARPVRPEPPGPPQLQQLALHHSEQRSKRGLLRVSRPSAPSHLPSRSSLGKASVPGTTVATAVTALAAAPPAACHAESDEPMPSPGGWEAAGHDDGMDGSLSPSASPPGMGRIAMQQEPQQVAAVQNGSAGPAVDEHFITSRRAGGGRQPRSCVREWSDDGSSDDEFPSPAGQRHRTGLTGLTQLDPASIVIARPKPCASSATWRSGDGGASGGTLGLKFLQRPPRGNAVRAHHGLANLKEVQFAEQVQVAAANGLVLSTKDKKTAVRLQPGGLTEEQADDEDFKEASSSAGGRRGSAASSVGAGGAVAQAPERGQGDEPTLAEPQTFYRLADGSWWLEYCRFFTAAQAEAAAAAAGRALSLPPGFDRSCELLKAVGREHAPVADVAGGVQVKRVKQGGAALRLRGGIATARSHFWRTAIDTASWRVVTDQPSADFVAIG